MSEQSGSSGRTGSPDRAALASAQFAAWARERAVPLPYPIDITPIAARDVAAPAPVPALLERFARVCADPREAAFALLVEPVGPTETAVAVAAADEAALLVMDARQVTVHAVRETDLVASIVEILPELAGLPIASHDVAEERWNALFQPIATKAPTRVIEPLIEAAGIPSILAEAMLATGDHPVRVGVLGASAWSGGRDSLGPTMASWFNYPRGALLATAEAPRHGVRQGQGRTVHLETYTLEGARRALTEAIASAQRASSRAAR